MNKEYTPNEILNLLGLKEEEKKKNTPEEEKPTPEEENPLESKKISKNPWSKLTLVGVCTGAGCLILGLFIQLWTSAQVSNDLQASTSKPTEELKLKEEESSLEKRNAQLAGKLALVEQERQIKALKDQKSESEDSTIPIPEKASTPKPQPQPVATRPTPRPQPVVTRPIPRPQPVATRSTPRPQPIAATSKTNPLEQWQNLAQLGSYSAPTNPETTANSTPVNSSIPTTQVSFNSQSPRETLIAQTVNSSPTLTPEDILKAGQQVKVTLTTPIVWSEGTQQEEFFMVTLSEPLINSQGTETLPIGTEILFSVQEISGNGLVIHQAIAILHEGMEYPIPSNRLTLRTQTNSPLIAKKTNNSNMAGADTTTFVLGALEKVGELSNRSTSSTITNGIGGFTQSQSFDSTNYVGGLLEGGLDPLNQQWQQRNQQRYAELQNQPDLWQIDPNQTLNLFVNRSFTLGETDAQTPNSRRRNR